MAGLFPKSTWFAMRRKSTANSIILKTPDEIAKMRRAGRLVAEIFAMLGEHIKPGVALIDLDHLVEEYIVKHGAQPLYKGYKGSLASHPPFPGVICASVNSEICHGIPDGRTLKTGDIIGVDIGLRYEGWCGDSCVTYPVGQVSPEAQHLLDATRQCLLRGIEVCHLGNCLFDIGSAIENYADTQGVAVVREWGGHGIGRSLHEAPSVSHTRMDSRGPRFRPGMVFTIEPMVNLGKRDWRLLHDGWTVVTQDGSFSAQFEHTVAITPKGPEVLTQL